jgi:transposase
MGCDYHIERGFRFLKDPLFMASTLYLKSPKRIMALMMVMTLCLLVYAALEYRIRQALQQHDQTFPNQKGQPTRTPTARWVFQFFTFDQPNSRGEYSGEYGGKYRSSAPHASTSSRTPSTL